MKFVRTKKLVFLNNKGGVGKTTIAFNTAIKFASIGYKTVLIDLDPQCNLSRLALGENFDNNLFSGYDQNIYGVLKGVIEGGLDVNTKIKFQDLRENLSILVGSLNLGLYEDLLSSSFAEAGSGQPLGYFNTSAIYRFLNEKGLNEDVDIFIIDASPSLGLLNRAILLGVDYFITPLNPDAFSVQGIENLGNTFEKWKMSWKNSAKVLAKTRDIPNSRVLDGEGLFLGYIINSYNQYSQKPIKSHREWIEKIPLSVKKYLSEKHCKNGLVEKSWRESLVEIKDFGELPTDGQIKNKAIFELIPGEDFASVAGTKENLELSKVQFEKLINNLIEILEKY